MLSTRSTVLAILLASLAEGAPAQSLGPPTPAFHDVVGLVRAGNPAISPDGRAIVYTVQTANWAENRFDSEIWLVRPGHLPLQLTRTAKASSTTPRWSPDGKWLAFLADRGDHQQIYLLDTAGGEAVQLTATKEGVANFRWSPVGGRIAFTANEPESPAMAERKLRYGDFTVQDAEWRQSHLWIIGIPATSPAAELAMPVAARLTEGGAFTVSDFAWSPDGTTLAVEHRRDPRINSAPSAEISLLDVGSKALVPLVQRPGFDGTPLWSPDGKWILFSTSAGDTTQNFYRNGELAKIAVAGGAPIRLAAAFDEQLAPVAWTPQGVWCLAWRKTRRELLLLDPVSGAVSPSPAAPPPYPVVLAASFTPDGNTAALLGQEADGLPEIWRVDNGTLRVTDYSTQIRSWALGSSEVVRWKSKDGEEIEGVLHKPRDFDAGRKYPLLVVIHGGPTGIDYPSPLPGTVYPIAQWVARGALVLRPNYRGSAGYGERFRSLNVRNLGVGDMWDVMSGVDELIKRGMVDTARMGAMGWSQGGYISAFLTTNTTRFKAISVGAGISNWVTYYVATDIHPFTRQYLGATPWDDPAIYARTSPMTTIRQARTPTQIQHGELDPRVPIQDAFELFQGLRDRGVPSRLIIYKGFGHGITKPKEQLAALWHNWEWFAQYVWGEQVEMPLR